jgi:hypothetical protein
MLCLHSQSLFYRPSCYLQAAESYISFRDFSSEVLTPELTFVQLTSPFPVRSVGLSCNAFAHCDCDREWPRLCRGLAFPPVDNGAAPLSRPSSALVVLSGLASWPEGFTLANACLGPRASSRGAAFATLFSLSNASDDLRACFMCVGDSCLSGGAAV